MIFYLSFFNWALRIYRKSFPLVLKVDVREDKREIKDKDIRIRTLG